MDSRDKLDNDSCDKAYRLFLAGRHEQAYVMYRHILADNPENTRALHAIGVVLHKMGKTEEGISRVREALRLKPDFADAHNNLGNIFIDTRRFEEAADCFRKSIEFKPDNDLAYKNLSLALLNTGKLEEAYQACGRALEIDPHQAVSCMTMANICSAMGDADLAFQMNRRACELAPDSFSVHTNLLYSMNFLGAMSQQAIYRESRRWGIRHAAEKYIRRPHLNAPIPDRRLRIGYVSGDFKLHPVSYHIKPVIEHHNREAFEIFLYSNYFKSDEMTEKLMGLAGHWRNIEFLPDESVDEMIRLDGIDILVDLSGHTASNRLLLFARKPAPVQVSWIGYFNTTGVKAIDYLISDAITVPSGEERWFTEQVVKLPDGRFCYEPPAYAPDVALLPALRNGYVTFGSFNKLAKVTPETVSIWSAVLKAVQGSRLVLKTAALEAESVRQRVLEQFHTYGVDSGRLEFRGDSPHPEMLAQYGDIDIALDTFPYNGGATTCEALWMGSPVVTLSGRIPISRQSSSFLASCGLSHLAAAARSEFVVIAQGLAADVKGLAELRGALRERLSNSPLFDGTRFAQNLEHAYRGMWHDWCERQKDSPRIRIHPAISAAEYYNAGITRMEDKDYASAVFLFKLAVRKRNDFAEAHNNLGICLFNLGKEHHEQATTSFRRAIRLKPDFGEACNNLGRLLTGMGSYSQAVKACRSAVELMPDNADAFINLGTACREKGLFLEASASYETAADLKPNDALPLSMIAGLKLLTGDAAGAIDFFKRARELQPDNPDIQSNILFAMNYVSAYSQQDICEESVRWDTRYGGTPFGLDFNDRFAEGDKLRVGYVSGDFHHHPVGVFFQAVARYHDTSNFEMVCYDNGNKTDEVNREIRKFSEHWRVIEGMSDDALLGLIQQDRIDILVDLSGHTGGNRLQIFSRRAAPVQVSWLGYFNTTGISNIDYVISDYWTVPLGCEEWYRETLVRMPHSRFCYTPPVICPDVEALPARKNGYPTFGCFNNIAKLTPEVIEAWARILRRVPDSKLVLKWKTLGDRTVRDYYRMLFSMHGIPLRRIEFRGQSPMFVMRDEYNDIDIALDPFPYTGGLTSCEALWMGVPVVTLAGERPVSRQTKGFLNVLGLDELASETISGYVDCAVGLSGDIERLAALRQGLRRRMEASPLCDGPGFTGTLEDIYRRMRQTWIEKANGCSGVRVE